MSNGIYRKYLKRPLDIIISLIGLIVFITFDADNSFAC